MCLLIFLVHPGLHFGDLGVERDGADKGCIIWCVYFHVTCVNMYLFCFFHFFVSTGFPHSYYYSWCALHHVYILFLHALLQDHLFPQYLLWRISSIIILAQSACVFCKRLFLFLYLSTISLSTNSGFFSDYLRMISSLLTSFHISSSYIKSSNL